MNLAEATGLLGWKREEVKTAIINGVMLPYSQQRIQLPAHPRSNDYDIKEDDLNDFVDCFEKQEPGRHPPIRVRRTLLVETNHRCAICQDSAPLQYHHIIEFAKLKHHDPKNMLAVCGTCHDKISLGQIDYHSQVMYKERLQDHFRGDSRNFPSSFSWDDLREIITNLHTSLSVTDPSSDSKYDFSLVEVTKKNTLNKLQENYFKMMRDHHEPYFSKIESFLKNPANTTVANLYYEIVDELRSKIAAKQGEVKHFDDLLIEVYDKAKSNLDLRGKLRILNILLSFMYFQCDIGRKT